MNFDFGFLNNTIIRDITTKYMNITSINIATDDDCISLGDGSKQIHVLNDTCGPWHGISVGSLEKYPNEELVKGLTVRNCTLNNTDNGCPSKIKISKVTFKNIIEISATQEGVVLICSSSVPCKDVMLSDIDLKFNGTIAAAKLANVKPIT
ncbi:hypothetical protein GYH30_049228 [Glycine max]|uniref:Polygalacturonase n=1 Tax=Glycine max TaxID=3847 RepID=A0A0R0EWT2_SOYBN|nr:hypothetical protein GYH30_049228 [Glycine max]